ncbi:MAG: HAD hydrolase-like protein [Lachnospiraceae bacterium]|nr:HAD hydrolase-like protein [Lachnospiraceae bacterium]
MRCSYCLFDLDGTLTQSEFGVGRSVRQALAHFGVTDVSDEELKKYIGPPLSHSFRYFAGFDERTTQEAIEIYRAVYNTEGYKEAPVYPGIFNALTKLREAGKRLAVVTSKPENIARSVLDHMKLTPHFDELFGPDESEADVGKEELILRALAHYRIEDDREQAVMIGDRKYDILGAKKAGVASIGVVYGYGSREELMQAGADHLAATPEELTEVILG